MSFPYDESVLSAISTAIPALNIHAREGLPEEVVGLVLYSGDILRLINQSRSAHKFTVSRAQLAEKLADIDPEEDSVVALYHSHPGGTTTLSNDDFSSMRHSWLRDGFTIPWVTVVPDSRVGVWWIDPQYSAPRSHIIHMDLSNA